MKNHLLAVLACVTLLSACRETNKTQIISIGVFETKDQSRQPTVAELVCLKAFVDSNYNPELCPQIIQKSELEQIGYSLRIFAHSELKPESSQIFNQGIQQVFGTTTALIAEIEPVGSGGYNLIMNFRDGSEAPQEANKRSVFVGVPSAGTIVLANGMIASWSTKVKN